jgi:hypothetical protein
LSRKRERTASLTASIEMIVDTPGRIDRVETVHLLEKVISGGQIGADQAGLMAAARYGIATGGWMPRGFQTLAGPDPELAARFGLREHLSEKYPPRTELNVRTSDGTIRFAARWKRPGEICTLKSLCKHRKPSLDVDIKAPRPVAEVVEWIRREGIRTLNVAGNVEPKSRKSPASGITDFVIDYLGQVFETLGHRRIDVATREKGTGTSKGT